MDLETRIESMLSRPTVVEQMCSCRTEEELQRLMHLAGIPAETPSDRAAASERCGRMLGPVEDTLDELCATGVMLRQQLERCREGSARQQLLRHRQEDNERELERMQKRQMALYQIARMLDPAQWAEE